MSLALLRIMQSVPSALTFDLTPSRHVVRAAVYHLLQRQAVARRAIFGEVDSSVKSPGIVHERRQHHREHVQIPLLLHPAEWKDDQICTLDGGPIVGISRDLSEQGLGMAYDVELPTDLVIVEFDLFAEGPLRLLLEVRWSRQRSPHDFLAGGEFCGLVTATR